MTQPDPSALTAFWHRWQSLPGRIDPVFLRFGTFEMRWYGLMYVVAFLTVYALVMRRLRREPHAISAETVRDIFTWIVLGIVAGGRLGYVFFYDFAHYAAHPAEILWPFSGGRFTGIAGMSYHGGVLGLFAVSLYYCRRHRIRFLDLADLIAPAVPLGYTFGRIGNFLNGELYGRVTSVPWGMVFPADPSGLLRHPSQLYEAFFEGLFLFAMLWALRNRRPFAGFHTACYLAGYGTLRFVLEFTREPDAQLGFVWGSFTMGQLLCAAMIAAAALIFFLPKASARPDARDT